MQVDAGNGQADAESLPPGGPSPPPRHDAICIHPTLSTPRSQWPIFALAAFSALPPPLCPRGHKKIPREGILGDFKTGGSGAASRCDPELQPMGPFQPSGQWLVLITEKSSASRFALYWPSPFRGPLPSSSTGMGASWLPVQSLNFNIPRRLRSRSMAGKRR